jgi:hypothetical protein
MDHYQIQDDQGGAELGSHGAPRRRTSTGPQYTRSKFTEPRIRALVAAACEDQIAALQTEQLGATAQAGVQFVIAELDDVVNELRAVN